jgi:hypothetical protein
MAFRQPSKTENWQPFSKENQLVQIEKKELKGKPGPKNQKHGLHSPMNVKARVTDIPILQGNCCQFG